MADVVFEGSSDFDKVKRDFDALHREMVKLREENKKYQDTAVRSSRVTREATTEQGTVFAAAATQVTGMVGGLLSVQAAVQTVIKMYGDWRAEMKRVGEQHTQTTQTLVNDLSATGDLREGSYVDQVLSHLPTVGRSEAVPIFRAVSGANPEEDIDRRLNLTMATSRMAAIEPDIARLASLTGELAKHMPDMAPRDVVDSALILRQLAGKNAERVGSDEFLRSVGSLEAAGMQRSMAMGLGVEALRQNQSPELLAQLAAKMQAPQLAGKSAEERLQTLLSGSPQVRQLLGAELAVKTQALDVGRARVASEQIDAAVSGDFVGQQLELAGQFASGKAQLARHNAAVVRERSLQQQGRWEEDFETLAQMMEADQRASGFSQVQINRARRSLRAQAGAYELTDPGRAYPTLEGFANSGLLVGDHAAAARANIQSLTVAEKSLEELRAMREALQRRPAVVTSGPPER